MLNFIPCNLFWWSPWLEASNIIFSIFLRFKFESNLFIMIESTVVLSSFKLILSDLTPSVPIEATFFLLSFNIW